LMTFHCFHQIRMNIAGHSELYIPWFCSHNCEGHIYKIQGMETEMEEEQEMETEEQEIQPSHNGN
jgi:hypothetical protein